MCRLSIVIVNTNTRELVCRCLDSIHANPPNCGFEIIVVDNASADESCETIELRYPQVRLVRNERNLGFSAANNEGFKIARGEHMLLLNSDTIVLPRSLDMLLSALEGDQSVGVVAPKLVYPDGSLQMSYGPMPSLFVSFCSFFELRRWVPQSLLERLGRSTRKELLGRQAGSYVGWLSGESPKTSKLQRHVLVTGACMLIRGECFRQVGALDPSFFMYVDDADYCKRVYDAGWEVQYLAEATIVHIKGGTVGERYRWTSPAAYYSVFYFLEKHRGKGVARTVKAMALTSLALRFIARAIVAPGGAWEHWKLLREVATGSGNAGKHSLGRLEEERGHTAD